MFDDKLALQPEFKHDGGKGGVKWKKKLENYMISRAPVLKGLLQLAEAEDLEGLRFLLWLSGSSECG